MNVVGGISKLIKTFIKEQKQQQQQQQQSPPSSGTRTKIDIVTVIDRDWGDGSNWYSLGFETVQTLSPLCMAVNPDERGVRRHLVGAGINPTDSDTSGSSGDECTTGQHHHHPHHHQQQQQQQRLGLPTNVWTELDRIGNLVSSSPSTATTSVTSQDVIQALADHSYYLVYDAGVERLMMKVDNDDDDHSSACSDPDSSSARRLWAMSKPTFTSSYYSPNAGIMLLLRDAEERDGSTTANTM
jgi:hypothetical protein